MIRHTYHYDKPFDFEAGGTIDGLDVVYHTSPFPYSGQKVIWICHALTANSDAEDWWKELVGPGRLFNTEKYFVICCNMVGSCYGTTGPASVDPKTGKPYYFSFPRVTVRDIVKAHNLVRESLGIKKIDLLVGASIGGFQALEWSIMYPDVVRTAFFVATLSRVTPWLTAFEESQRLALEADQTFRACESLEGGRKGLECARSIALLSYRNEDGYNRRQWEQSDDTFFADRACSYQRHQGKKLADRFDAYSYWYLSYSVDSDNVGRNRGGEAAALGTIKAESYVIGIDSDLIFPPYEMKVMAQRIPGSKYLEITSHFGHDGFLLEYEQITKIVEPILNTL